MTVTFQTNEKAYWLLTVDKRYEVLDRVFDVVYIIADDGKRYGFSVYHFYGREGTSIGSDEQPMLNNGFTILKTGKRFQL